MFSDKYFQKFKSLCAMADADSAMQIDELRRIILYRSNGLCPATMIVSKQDATFLSVKQMCTEETYAQVKRKGIFASQDMEGFAKKMRKTEVKMMSSLKSKCTLGSQKQIVDDLAEKYKDDCKEFRRNLLDSHVLDVVAIHFCRWDGSPRKSVVEIRDAICLYPTSPKKMLPLLKLLVKVALGAAFVGGVYTLGHAGGVDATKDKFAERLGMEREDMDYLDKNF